MSLANARIGQLLIPVDDFEKGVAFYRDVLGLPFLFAARPQVAFFKSELWLAEFSDPDGNQLALMSDVASDGV